MKAALCLSALCIAAVLAIADGTKDSEDVAIGRKAFARSCVNCHVAPDLTIERDRVWLGMIKTTA